MHTLEKITQELTKALAVVGILPFWQREFEGGTLSDNIVQKEYSVGVWAGYHPAMSAIFSVILRFHPGELLDDYLCLGIASEHTQEFKARYSRMWKQRDRPLDPIFSDRIYDGRCIRWGRGETWHPIPVIGADQWYGETGNLHRSHQSLCDIENPWEDKVPYVADIFGSFMEEYCDSLLPRFTEGPLPNVVPQWSKNYQELNDQLRPSWNDILRRYWNQALGEIEEEIITNPAFPLPPAVVSAG